MNYSYNYTVLYTLNTFLLFSYRSVCTFSCVCDEYMIQISNNYLYHYNFPELHIGSQL